MKKRLDWADVGFWLLYASFLMFLAAIALNQITSILVLLGVGKK